MLRGPRGFIMGSRAQGKWWVAPQLFAASGERGPHALVGSLSAEAESSLRLGTEEYTRFRVAAALPLAVLARRGGALIGEHPSRGPDRSARLPSHDHKRTEAAPVAASDPTLQLASTLSSTVHKMRSQKDQEVRWPA
jgi:hypothetical protein